MAKKTATPKKSMSVTTQIDEISDINIEDLLNTEFREKLKKNYTNVMYAGISIIFPDSNELYIITPGIKRDSKNNIIVAHTSPEDSKENTLETFHDLLKSLKVRKNAGRK